MTEPAYTPHEEYNCTPESTHYQGCQCHEARRDDEITKLKERIATLESALDVALEFIKKCEDSTIWGIGVKNTLAEIEKIKESK